MSEVLDNFNFDLEKRKYRTSLLKTIGFYKQIEDFSELIQRISLQNFSCPRFISHKRAILCLFYGMDSSVFSLKGIIELCEIGDVIDAFNILRKIRDNIYLDLFFRSEASNNIPNNYENDKPISDMSPQELEEELIEYACCVLETEEKNENIQNINSWFDNELINCSETSKRIGCFSFSNYKKNLESKNPALKECHDKYLMMTFGDLNNKLNNYVHSNGPIFISNDIICGDKDSYLNAIKDLLKALNIIKRLLIIDLFLIDSTLFQTDDYIDAIEMGLEPEEGSQYHVIYQVVEEFQKIQKENEELYLFLKNNNRFCMKCFDN